MRSGTGERAQTFISSAGLPADESDEQRKGDEGPALTVTRGPAARALGLSVNWEDPPPPENVAPDARSRMGAGGRGARGLRRRTGWLKETFQESWEHAFCLQSPM